MNERQRIEKIIEAEHVTAREFAAQVGISAGTLSNILSGRNNPSLDVMKAILNVYRNISSDWLILDAGTMYRSGARESSAEKAGEQMPLFPMDNGGESSGNEADRGKEASVKRNNGTEIKKVQKILIFYTDGTFEER